MATAKNSPARAAKTRGKTRIQREKEEIILEAALDLFSAAGFDGPSVDQIANAAGMSKPNLLYYFARKEDVYVALLERLYEMWLEPMTAIDPTGDPIEELRGYLQRKLDLSRANPRASRLFANEVLRGAPHAKEALAGPMRALLVEKVAVIQGWIDAGRLAKIDPTHLIFAIWATTQHYADFEAQVRLMTHSDDDSHYDTARETLEALFLNGLRVR